ncbi:hypothetical protein Mapa_009909 [Marchantia paleacea]|nr:hypothetical protein Mapa_009909 [Marchantia paleacea]
MPMQYQFCRVCRQNHNQGKGHRFSTKHKLRVEALLKKFQKNIQEVKFFLKNAMRLRDDFGNRSKFWCNFCEQETSEDKSEFACAETIRHLASKAHVEAVKSFWFENGGDVGKRSSFHFSEIDFDKWEEACRMAPLQDGHDSHRNQMNNIHSDRSIADAASTENVNENSIVFGSSLAVKPLSVLTDQSFQHSCLPNGKVQFAAATSSQPGTVNELKKPYADNGTHPDGKSLIQDAPAFPGQLRWQLQVATPAEPLLSGQGYSKSQSSPSSLLGFHNGKQMWSGSLVNNGSIGGVSVSLRQTENELGQGFTVIRPPSLNPGEGNVHSGALPPWIRHDTGQRSQVQPSVSHYLGSSLPLSRTQERKLTKLRNPNRVGAAWAEQRRAEMEREHAGEVVEKCVPGSATWLPNFGRVWQSGSRRETRKEFESEKRSERKKRPRGESRRTLDNTKLRPYVSKRQRTMEET